MATALSSKPDDERRAILRAAYRLIGRSESGSTSVSEILAEAGLSTRAFYRHFASKDELILAMYRADSERVAAELASSVAAATGPVEAITAWLDHWLAIAFDPRRANRVRVLASTEARQAAGFARAQAQSLHASLAVLIELVDAGARAGAFATVTPESDARALQAIVNGLLDSRLRGESTPGWQDARAETLDVVGRILGCRLS
jgi:AcrR family transcriptional regulator